MYVLCLKTYFIHIHFFHVEVLNSFHIWIEFSILTIYHIIDTSLKNVYTVCVYVCVLLGFFGTSATKAIVEQEAIYHSAIRPPTCVQKIWHYSFSHYKQRKSQTWTFLLKRRFCHLWRVEREWMMSIPNLSCFDLRKSLAMTQIDAMISPFQRSTSFSCYTLMLLKLLIVS